MEKQKLSITSIAIVVLLVFLFISIFCLIFSPRMEANTSSIIGGVLSAFATIFLGIIAVWQNKRYKDQSDENARQISRITQTPECCFVGASKDYANNSAPCIDLCLDAASNEYQHFLFASLSQPIVNLRVESIALTNQKANLDFRLSNSMQKINYLEQDYFVLKITFPKDQIETIKNYDLVLKYENIYGAKATKHILINQIWGNGSFEYSLYPQPAQIIEFL